MVDGWWLMVDGLPLSLGLAKTRIVGLIHIDADCRMPTE
jgi:hypothetical protein